MITGPYIALDFETGGTNPSVHAPVSLGLALMEGEEVFAQEEFIFARMDGDDRKANQRRGYELRAMEVTGLRVSQFAKGEDPERVVELVREWTRKHDAADLPVVSYNASFDQSFWSELLFLTGKWDRTLNAYAVCPEVFGGPWWCVRRLFRVRFPERVTSKLDDALAVVGLSREGELHGALEDAVLCGRLLSRLTEKVAA